MGGVLWVPKVLQDEISFSYVLFSALLQQRITAPVVETSCILRQYFLLQKDKGKGQRHFSFKDGWALLKFCF